MSKSEFYIPFDPEITYWWDSGQNYGHSLLFNTLLAPPPSDADPHDGDKGGDAGAPTDDEHQLPRELARPPPSLVYFRK